MRTRIYNAKILTMEKGREIFEEKSRSKTDGLQL